MTLFGRFARNPVLIRIAVRSAIFSLALSLLFSAGAQAQIRGGSKFFGPPAPSALRNLPSIRVSLSKSEYVIRVDPKTGAPHMPEDILASAQALNWPAGAPVPNLFTWRVYLDWDFPGYPTHHSIKDKMFAQPSPFKVNLGGEIRGGTLTVIARAPLAGQEVCGQARAEVIGENPSRSVVLRSFPRSRFGFIASKIGMAESGLCQFAANGQPSLSRTKDIGMMQLNAPSGSITSADQIWDWRANLKRGLEMLGVKRQITVLASRHAVNLPRTLDESDPTFALLAYLNCARLLLGLPCLLPPDAPPLSEKPGTGLLPGEVDPDHIALSQVEREAIRRYNGGREYVYRYAPDPATLGIVPVGWQVDPERGGIRVSAGDPEYVHHVLEAHSGFTLPPPPSKHVKPSRRRHRRHHKSR